MTDKTKRTIKKNSKKMLKEENMVVDLELAVKKEEFKKEKKKKRGAIIDV